jgi:hypothetical protein
MIAYKIPGTYSYGDSAGFTPDFPFNPGHIRGPKITTKVKEFGEGKKRSFTLRIT